MQAVALFPVRERKRIVFTATTEQQAASRRVWQPHIAGFAENRDISL